MNKGSLISNPLTLVSCLPNNSYPERRGRISHCDCDFISRSLAILNTFHVSIGHFYVLFGKLSIQILRPFFNWVCCGFFFFIFCNWLVEFLIFWILSSYQDMPYKYVLAFHRLSFLHFVVSLSFRSFLAWGSPVCLFLLCYLYLQLKINKNYKINVKELFSHVFF